MHSSAKRNNTTHTRILGCMRTGKALNSVRAQFLRLVSTIVIAIALQQAE